MISRTQIQEQLVAYNADPAALEAVLADIPLTDELGKWLGKLKLLKGVPINYLVPDERMLPKESIRFFYLDINWIDALIDGAFSIGRNLNAESNFASINLDRSQLSKIKNTATLNAAAVRPNALGQQPSDVPFEVVTGFLLRSSIVKDYKGIGVNAYPKGGTPSDDPIELLDILRFEQLGPNTDTMICLIAGDAYQIDVHEAPEALHYGIDNFSQTEADKSIHPFTKDEDGVTMDLVADDLIHLNLKDTNNNCFRDTAPRTMKMNALAQLIGQSVQESKPQTPAITTVDASEMGFEMTEGVGNVSFMLNI